MINWSSRTSISSFQLLIKPFRPAACLAQRDSCLPLHTVEDTEAQAHKNRRDATTDSCPLLRHCKGQQHHLPDISRGRVIRLPCDVMTGGPRGLSVPRHLQAPSLFHPVRRDLERNVVLEDPTQDQLCVVYLVLIPLRLWASLSTCLLSAAPGTRRATTVNPVHRQYVVPRKCV